jgi:hypothetical protein
MVQRDQVLLAHQERLLALVATIRLPAMYGNTIPAPLLARADHVIDP